MESKNGVAAVPVSAFDPELMAEELKIGDKTFTMRPLVFKKYRQLAAVIDASMKDFAELDTTQTAMSTIMDMVFARDVAILRHLFPTEADLLTDAFIENNMTAPQMRFVVERGILLNNLGDIYPFLLTKKSVEAAPSAEKTPTSGA